MPTGGTKPGKGKKGKKGKRNRPRFKTTLPALGSYDPQIDENIRQLEAGFSDRLQDLAQQGRWGKQDWKEGKRDSKRIFQNQMQDLELGRNRGLRTIRENRDQLLQRGGRSETDFKDRLTAISRGTDLASVAQAESANVRGVSGGGTLAAANAIRARRAAEAREPADKWIAREREDIENLQGSQLRQEEELLEDYGTNRGRYREARQDQRSDARRAYKRDRRLRKRARSRSRRDVMGQIQAQEQQAAWQAEQNKLYY